MVLHHVAQRPGGVVVCAAAAFHAERLGHGDLDVVDVLLIEERLEDRVAEAERQDVLHGLFSEVVIDAVDLALVEHLGDRRVERAGAVEVVAEGLLDDDARPGLAALLVDERRGRQVLDDDGEELGGDGKIEHAVAGQVPLALDALDGLLERLEGLELVGVAGVIVELADQRIVRRDLLAAVLQRLAERLAHGIAVRLVAHRRARESDHREVFRQVPRLLEMEQRGDQLALREIAGGAEDHQRERILGADEVETRVGRARPDGGRNRSSEATGTLVRRHRRGSLEPEDLTRMRGGIQDGSSEACEATIFLAKRLEVG